MQVYTDEEITWLLLQICDPVLCKNDLGVENASFILEMLFGSLIRALTEARICVLCISFLTSSLTVLLLFSPALYLCSTFLCLLNSRA